jgi:hypothetical protein
MALTKIISNAFAASAVDSDTYNKLISIAEDHPPAEFSEP